MKKCSNKVYIKKKVVQQFKDANYVDDEKDEDNEVDSDDLNDAFDSDEESAVKEIKTKKKQRFNRQGRKFKQEVDTNVMSINLRVLKEDAQLASGDPIFCEGCRAAFNMYSKIVEENPDVIQEHKDEENENGDVEMKAIDQIWKCEFCNYKNKVVIDREEIPDKDAINYVIEGGEEVKIEEEKHDGSSIIFLHWYIWIDEYKM